MNKCFIIQNRNKSDLIGFILNELLKTLLKHVIVQDLKYFLLNRYVEFLFTLMIIIQVWKNKTMILMIIMLNRNKS